MKGSGKRAAAIKWPHGKSGKQNRSINVPKEANENLVSMFCSFVVKHKPSKQWVYLLICADPVCEWMGSDTGWKVGSQGKIYTHNRSCTVLHGPPTPSSF